MNQNPDNDRDGDVSPTADPQESTNRNDANPKTLTGLLEHFVDATEGQDEVKIVDLLDSLSSRSHGPMLLFPSVIAISPIGMIPGMSFITGTLIILIAAQMMIFAGRPWIPQRLENFQFSREKLTQGVDKTKPWVRWFETAVHQRLDYLASGVMIYPIAIVSILLALSFYPLALVPFGVMAPGFAIAMFALGLTARDGLLILLGLAMTALAIGLIIVAWPF